MWTADFTVNYPSSLDEVETLGVWRTLGLKHLWAQLPPLFRFFHEKEVANVLSVMKVDSVFQPYTIIFLKNYISSIKHPVFIYNTFLSYGQKVHNFW